MATAVKAGGNKKLAQAIARWRADPSLFVSSLMGATPDENQAAIMSVSGERLSRMAGQAWDTADTEGYKLAKEKNLPTVTADPEMTAEYFNLVSKLETEWVAKAKAKGVDGAAALAELRAIAKGYKSN